jgi:hypothetical protein
MVATSRIVAFDYAASVSNLLRITLKNYRKNFPQRVIFIGFLTNLRLQRLPNRLCSHRVKLFSGNQLRGFYVG